MDSICDDLARLDAAVPLIAMTYYNIVLHYGLERARGQVADQRHQRRDHSRTWPWKRRRRGSAACDESRRRDRVAWSRRRRQPIASNVSARAPRASPTRRRGWPSPARRPGEGTASASCASIRRTSDVPALVGIGIATADQAKEAATVSDGVIVGSALVQVILDGGGAD